MRLVFVNYNYSPDFDSPESWFERIGPYSGILECLSKKNTVISIKQINFKGQYDYKGVQYHFVDCGKNKWSFPVRVNNYVKTLKPDIVLVQGLHQPLQVIHLRSKLGAKTAIIAHHHGEQPFPGIKKYVQLWASRHVDAYLFASHEMGRDWVKKGNISDRKRIHELMEVSSVFYPIEKKTARKKTKVTGTPFFLWVGRLNNNKDPLCVVRAFLRYAQTRPSARLYMIYQTGELLPEIQELLQNHANGLGIVLIGYVPNDELLYWYNSADALISGSHYEGSGTAIAEAMSCGCVPIVTDIPSFRMITNNGKCGFLYEAGNEDGLLNILQRLEKEEMAEMKQMSLDYFKAKLSFEAIARDIEEIAGMLC